MTWREQIIDYADTQLPLYRQIALEIHARPEVSNYEFFACERLSNQLKAEGFDVKVDVAGHRTGFSASYRAARPGPVVVFLAEYDALGGFGHACGHNLFGATSALAAASLRQVIDQTGGEVRVYGTPGEEGGENGSAKGSFVREGFLRMWTQRCACIRARISMFPPTGCWAARRWISNSGESPRTRPVARKRA